MPNLSNAQLTALKNNILANPNVSAWVAGGVDNSVKDWYNQNTVTMAWKSSFSSDDLLDAVKFPEYLARSNAERQAFDLLVTKGSFNPEKASYRKAIADIFSGATNSTSRVAILTAMTEPATNAEVLFGGNNVTTDTVTALKRNWTGKITDSDVAKALRD